VGEAPDSGVPPRPSVRRVWEGRTLLAGAGLDPVGDVVHCDVTREATSDVLGWLKELGLYDEGAVAISQVDAAPSRNAWRTEKAAPGAPDDAVVWDAVVDQSYNEARGSWVYYAFLTLATLIAAVAVVTDSSILVVGASAARRPSSASTWWA
jgi:hypothetical protein